MALKSINIPAATYPVGVTNIPVQTVPLGVVRVDVTLDTTNWTDPASRLAIALEVSRDNQTTWGGGGATDMQCRADGTFRNRDGTIRTTATCSFTWPAGVTHVRGAFTVSGAAIQTGGSIEVN